MMCVYIYIYIYIYISDRSEFIPCALEVPQEPSTLPVDAGSAEVGGWQTCAWRGVDGLASVSVMCSVNCFSLHP